MTMQLIETKTLATAAAAIEFTSIPQTFTDLVIVMSCRTDRAAGVDGINGNINGSSANFTSRNLIGDGSVSSSNSTSVGTLGLATDSLNTANTFGNSVAYITNYTAATNKSISSDQVIENNAAASFQILRAILWSNTAAITSINFVPQNGTNIVAGSTISLYGVLKGSDGIVITS
jgi:hypothetical protein